MEGTKEKNIDDKDFNALSPNTWLLSEYRRQFGYDEDCVLLDDFDVLDRDVYIEQLKKDANDNITLNKHACICGREFHTEVAATTCLTSHQNVPIKDSMILDGEKIYACIKCSFNTNNRVILEKHKTIHNNSKPYTCDACPYSTQFLHVLEHHKSGHKVSKQFKCDKCSYSCHLLEALKRHNGIHLLGEPLSCDQCNFKSILKDVMTRHKATHNNSRGYVCEECGFHCINLATYNKHTITHLPFPVDLAVSEVKYPKPFECQHCPMTFARADSLSVHTRTHTGSSPYCCEECSFTFKDRYSLKKHINLIHSGAAAPLQCADCSYSTLYKGDLNKHILMHKGKRRFKCDQCDFTGLLSGDLRRHQLTHGGEKKYKCEFCDYTCARTDYLKVHTQMHTKPFSCPKCDYKTAQAKHLKIHMLTHTGEKPFACNSCEYRTRTSKHLIRHKKFSCKVNKIAQQLMAAEKDTQPQLEKLNDENSKEPKSVKTDEEDTLLSTIKDKSSSINHYIKSNSLKKLMDEGKIGDNNRQLLCNDLKLFIENDDEKTCDENNVVTNLTDTVTVNQDNIDREFIDFVQNNAQSRQLVADEILKLMIDRKEDSWTNSPPLRVNNQESYEMKMSEEGTECNKKQNISEVNSSTTSINPFEQNVFIYPDDYFVHQECDLVESTFVSQKNNSTNKTNQIQSSTDNWDVKYSNEENQKQSMNNTCNTQDISLNSGITDEVMSSYHKSKDAVLEEDGEYLAFEAVFALVRDKIEVKCDQEPMTTEDAFDVAQEYVAMENALDLAQEYITTDNSFDVLIPEMPNHKVSTSS